VTTPKQLPKKAAAPKKPATAKKKAVRASGSTYTVKLGDEICKWIAGGETLREYCRQKKKDWSTIYNWIKRYPEFAEKMELARKMGGHAIAEDTIEIIDQKPERIETEYGTKIDPAFVQWQKNRAEQRMKLLAKWHPKEYGDKLDLTGNLTTTPENVQNELVALLTALQPKQKNDSADN
jgi:hypothetical protein